MGILNKDIALLLSKFPKGTSIGNVLTIGRLNNRIDKDFMQRIGFHDEGCFYFDELLPKIWKARIVESLDVSSYQKSSIVHDLNFPIDDSLLNKYDLVIEGGSLEHIFNFPVALTNLVKMLKPGGTLFMSTMANNHCGHGFYQFSPELFFSVFSGESFKNLSIYLAPSYFPGAELFQKSFIYKVESPIKIKGRVGLRTNSPITINVMVERTEKYFDEFESIIQSDYKIAHKNLYKENNFSKQNNLRLFFRGLKQIYTYSFFNKRFYKKSKLLDLLNENSDRL